MTFTTASGSRYALVDGALTRLSERPVRSRIAPGMIVADAPVDVIAEPAVGSVAVFRLLCEPFGMVRTSVVTAVS